MESPFDGKIFSVRTRLMNWNGRPSHVHYVSRDRNEMILQNVGCATAIYTINEDLSVSLRYGNQKFFEMFEGTVDEIRNAFDHSRCYGYFYENSYGNKRDYMDRRNHRNFGIQPIVYLGHVSIVPYEEGR